MSDNTMDVFYPHDEPYRKRTKSEKNINDLWREILQHPDYLGGVLWTPTDIEMVAEQEQVPYILLIDAVRLDRWEESAIERGFDAIQEAANTLKIDHPEV